MAAHPSVLSKFIRELFYTNNNLVAAIEVSYFWAVPDAVTGDIDLVMPDKVEVLEVICRKDAGAGAGNTMQVKTGAGVAISNAIACDTDKTITRSSTIDTATNVILANGVLRLTATKAAGTRTALVEARCVLRP
jgi:hypothetical protein